jgi:hypothetical protein
MAEFLVQRRFQATHRVSAFISEISSSPPPSPTSPAADVSASDALSPTSDPSPKSDAVPMAPSSKTAAPTPAPISTGRVKVAPAMTRGEQQLIASLQVATKRK